MGRGLAAEHNRRAAHALTADQSNFDQFAILDCDDGRYTRVDEIHILDWSIGLFQFLTQLECDGREVGPQQLEIGRRQRGEKPITWCGRGGSGWGHGSFPLKGGKSTSRSPKRGAAERASSAREKDDGLIALAQPAFSHFQNSLNGFALNSL